MKCVVCKLGDLTVGATTLTFERGNSTVVVKGVPARVCSNCGEAYIDEEISAQALKLAEEAASSGIEVEVRQFAA